MILVNLRDGIVCVNDFWPFFHIENPNLWNHSMRDIRGPFVGVNNTSLNGHYFDNKMEGWAHKAQSERCQLARTTNARFFLQTNQAFHPSGSEYTSACEKQASFITSELVLSSRDVHGDRVFHSSKLLFLTCLGMLKAWLFGDHNLWKDRTIIRGVFTMYYGAKIYGTFWGCNVLLQVFSI